jgi:hypothetical protein
MKQWGWGKQWIGIGVVLLFTQAGCTANRSISPTRQIQIEQTWQLQPGDAIAQHRVVAGLGDISIHLKGDSVYAPFDGEVQQNLPGCVLFSSPDVPAYLFRLCGLNQPKIGEVRQGKAIGSGEYLHVATLRKQPEGTWAMVEPAKDVLDRMLQP